MAFHEASVVGFSPLMGWSQSQLEKKGRTTRPWRSVVMVRSKGEAAVVELPETWMRTGVPAVTAKRLPGRAVPGVAGGPAAPAEDVVEPMREMEERAAPR